MLYLRGESLPLRYGVLTGEEATLLYQQARAKEFALPAVNVVNSDGLCGALEAAKASGAPIIIQISYGGSQHFAGQGLMAWKSEVETAVAGAVAMAHLTRQLALVYQVPVILHSDHAPKSRLPWVEGLLQADADYFTQEGVALFTSHMIDLSKEPLEYNLNTSSDYFRRMVPLGLALEIEMGCTGGEEDGISGAPSDNLYSDPEEVAEAYRRLAEIGKNFSLAATFGNVHGVYAPGKVALKPERLAWIQSHLSEKFSLPEKPANLVFHGSSGSSLAELQTAVRHGVVKVNIDTDTQWAQWKGIKEYYAEHADYLQTPVGNPKGETLPNKSYYDPRKWLRKAQLSFSEHLRKLFKVLNAEGQYREIAPDANSP